MTAIRKFAICALVVPLCLWLQGCSTPKTHISETEWLSDRLLALAVQDGPLALDEVAQTLQVQLSDYEDIRWAMSGWAHVLRRKSPETRPIISIWLSEPRPQNPRQALWVVFDASTCLSLEAMGQKIGQSVVQRYFPGFADVRGGWLTLLEWEGQSTSSELMAPMGCSRRFEIYKTRRE